MAVLAVLLLALVAFLMVTVPTSRQARTYFDLLREVSPNLIAAIGITLLMLAGEFDLSIGSMLAVTGVVTVALSTSPATCGSASWPVCSPGRLSAPSTATWSRFSA